VLAGWAQQVALAEAETARLQARCRPKGGPPTLLALADTCLLVQQQLDAYQTALARAGISTTGAVTPMRTSAPTAAAASADTGDDRSPMSDVNRTPTLSAFGISSTTLDVLQNKGTLSDGGRGHGCAR
jgi:hypothetical protein